MDIERTVTKRAWNLANSTVDDKAPRENDHVQRKETWPWRSEREAKERIKKGDAGKDAKKV
jgi:hypothetical protein